MLDLLIQNGMICDGSGTPAYKGDVGIRDGKVVAVGEVTSEARETIDAKGLTIAPGFIDPHTHYDAQLVWDGLAQPSLEHGITTIVPGNCSLSLAPLKPEHRDALGATFRKIEEMPKNAFDAGITWEWETFGEYLDAIKRGGLGINVAPLVGHSLLRLWVMGEEAASSRAATDAEIEQLQELLDECMRAGAIGMSGSWVDVDYKDRPVPARYADAKELDALCATLGKYAGVLQMVPEFFDSQLICARIDIMADLSRKHGITCTFSPMFDSNDSPNLVYITLDRVRQQVMAGAKVAPQMQVRPIDLSFELTQPTSTIITLPTWWQMTLMPMEEKVGKLKDPEYRKLLADEMDNFKAPLNLQYSFADGFIKRMGKEDPALMGRNVGELAAERGVRIGELMIDLSLENDFEISFGFSSVGHNNTAKIGELMHDPVVTIGAADGGAHVTNFSTYGDTGFMFSHYVRGHQSLSVEEAVQKLTHDVAKFWGLKDRGLLRPGYAADVIVFDPETFDRGPEVAVNDLPADGFRYIRHSIGMAHVIVNGVHSFSEQDGGYLEGRGGVIAERMAA
ncbi:N-acyl-D-amino-acid deacylase family protein [Sphingobium tyrosinilyticum]|uniref:Amidohydrolase family protein n=1 Tax=Sphingobium tyrosinilyticum TaxID=2715436 RepID=A0ABV9F3V3_9SPHN